MSKPDPIPSKEERLKTLESGFAEITKTIKADITAQFAAFTPAKPRGWKRAAYFLREWGVLGIAIGSFLTLAAIAASAIYVATSEVSKNAQFRGSTEEHLKTVDTRLTGIEVILKDIQKDLLLIRSRQVSSQPARAENQIEAQAILSEARSKSIQIPQSIIADSGSAFIEVSNRSPSAWSAALEFLNYYSSLKRLEIPIRGIQPGAPVKYAYDFGNSVTGKDFPEVKSPAASIAVAPEDSALYQRIGKPHSKDNGFAAITLTGGAVNLDNMEIRRAVFDSVEIHYTGKPLIMDTVGFFNCTFVLENTEPSRQLGQRLLMASGPFSFRNVS